jgi:hypothetical protein
MGCARLKQRRGDQALSDPVSNFDPKHCAIDYSGGIAIVLVLLGRKKHFWLR